MELSQKSLTGIQKFFLFQVPMNIQKDWKAKSESAYYFMLKYSKIAVCLKWPLYTKWPFVINGCMVANSGKSVYF